MDNGLAFWRGLFTSFLSLLSIFASATVFGHLRVFRKILYIVFISLPETKKRNFSYGLTLSIKNTVTYIGQQFLYDQIAQPYSLYIFVL